ncbi:MAG: outer membrane beta-barrel protein [Gallionella sp.]|nr:outer membrane beta-barrel protein [Gallionella sp.]MDD4945305.1 outer membrane beta-barrel protein [Gallionella sp.]MDD5613071.1 outer membrane beta-barrel protein [Gallionella sp.]
MGRYVVAGVCLLFVSSAQADESGFYVSGAAGQTFIAYPGVTTDLAVRQLKVAGVPVVTGVNSSYTRNPLAYRLYLGYQFDQYWALEGGYTDFGHVQYKALVSTLLGGLYGSEVAGTTAWSMTAVGRYPLTDELKLVGKLGVARSKNTSQVVVLPAVVSMAGASDNLARTAVTFGFGLQYQMTDNWEFRADWDHFRASSTPLVVVSAGLTRRF